LNAAAPACGLSDDNRLSLCTVSFTILLKTNNTNNDIMMKES